MRLSTSGYHDYMDGIRWIGEYSHKAPNTRAPGMLGGISLTVARDIDTEDFLVSLGAEPLQLDEGYLYKDRRSVTLPDGVDPRKLNYAMYGTCGDWVYVLEEGDIATWYLHRNGGPSMPMLAGVETICLSRNRYTPPSCIAHATPEGFIVSAEFGEDTGRGSDLDAALKEAGAVYPSVLDTPEDEVHLYWEEHEKELPQAVFSAVGKYCGLSIDQTAVDAGELPVVVFFPLS